MDLFICSKCGANLIECGITEVTVGGVGETDISFKKNALYPINDSGKEVEYGSVDVHDFDEQWVVCLSCGAELHDRTAIEIIEAFENDLPHVRDECEVCGKTFTEVKCSECSHHGDQCTGVLDERTMCQKCCAEDFADTIRNNPVAALLSEAS